MDAPRTLFWITTIGVVVTVLEWAEHSAWLPQWLSLFGSRVPFDILTKLLVFIVLLLGAHRLGKIERRQREQLPRQSDFLLITTLDDGRHIVELDSKQYELGRGAFEYYSGCNPQQKTQIISAMRNRYWHTPRWDKNDFVLIVDEKEALRQGIASLIRKGNEIEQEIHFAPRPVEPERPMLSLLSAIPPAWRNHLTDWWIESKKWLEKNIPREAPAFARPPQFTVTGDPVLDGLAELNDYRERLIHIQNRI